jgi:ABC-type antimicrobial peptide transport system permease subunit
MWQVLHRLMRRPIYAMSVMLVLGCGLGAAYCLYGIVDTVLFRPLQIADADRVVAREAPGSSLIQASTLQGRMDDLTARDRAITTVAGGSAVFATLLAVVGMYGIAAFSVRHRQREIGIRYSLGATRGNVILRFLRRGALVSGAGILLGGLSTLMLSPRFAGTMSGMNDAPLFELFLVAVLLGAIAILANLIPVWRAAGVAPMDVLRDE